MDDTSFVSAFHKRDIGTLKSLLEKEPDLVNKGYSVSTLSWLNMCFHTENHNDDTHCECVELLVNHGAHINERNSDSYYLGLTPVMHAVNIKCFRCLKFLIAKGADLSFETSLGTTALIHSVKKGTYTSVNTSIKHSTLKLINHKDNQGKTALMWAAESCEENAPFICQQLIEAGADLNITDLFGQSALMLVVKGHNLRCADVLIQHSTLALINHRDKEGKTALMLAAESYEEEAPTLCQQLIEAEADINVTAQYENTALLLAVKRNNFKNAKVLVQNSTPALINHRDNNGETAFILATKCLGKDTLSFCQQLKKAGADVNIPDKFGNTALMLAVKKNKIKLAKSLIQNFSHELTQRDNTGKNVLMWATECFGQHAISLIEHLLKAGADLSMTDTDGNTALFWLSKEIMSEMLKL